MRVDSPAASSSAAIVKAASRGPAPGSPGSRPACSVPAARDERRRPRTRCAASAASRTEAAARDASRGTPPGPA